MHLFENLTHFSEVNQHKTLGLGILELASSPPEEVLKVEVTIDKVYPIRSAFVQVTEISPYVYELTKSGPTSAPLSS